jgi:hypothetical protein
LLEWFESDDVLAIVGHIGERGDSGHWDTFQFEVVDNDGDQHTITIGESDIPDGAGMDWWDDFFDYLDDYAEEYDTDYENKYGGD